MAKFNPNTPKNIMNVIKGAGKWLTTSPVREPGTQSKVGKALSSAGRGATNIAWRNRTPLGKLAITTALGIPAYRYGRDLFGDTTTPYFNEANLPFVTPNTQLDKIYQQQLEATNKLYNADAQTKAIEDLYAGLGYATSDVYEKAARDMAAINAGGSQPGAMTDAQYNAAINAAYSTPANEVSAQAAMPSTSGISGMVATPTAGRTTAADIRDLGKIGAEEAKAKRYISQTGLNTDVLAAQEQAKQIPAMLDVLAQVKGMGIRADMESQRRAALADLASTYAQQKIQNRGLPPIQATQSGIQQSLREYNKLNSEQKKTVLNSALSPAELATYRGQGLTDAEIYVALRNGLI